MKGKSKWIFLGLLILLTHWFGGCARNSASSDMESGGSVAPEESVKYGVFIGADPAQLDAFAGYDVIVIDAAFYSKADLDRLHADDITVYSYLNVGSIEDFRDYFADYKALILDEYENWPGEYWVDVANPKWQSHIREQAADLAQKGVDGFFIDNADVYYQYHTPDVFEGLVTILSQLGEYDKDIIINGGDIFVTEAVLEAEAPMLKISGVNQECVFTNIDFEGERLIRQSKETTRYYQDYLELCKVKELDVYLLEYGKEQALLREIEAYCAERRFYFYMASSIDLQSSDAVRT